MKKKRQKFILSAQEIKFVTTFIFCFENFFSSTTKQDNAFCCECKNLRFLQVFYVRKISRMVRVRVVPSIVTYLDKS